MTRYPINIDTTDYAAFDQADPNDAACDRERRSFLDHFQRRLKKGARTGGNTSQIYVGALHALVQFVFAAHEGRPDDAARDGLHQAVDHLWLNSSAQALTKDRLQ